MNSREKRDKKAYIGKLIDLANGKFKDSEVDTLYDIVQKRDEYNGRSKTYRNQYTGWSSEGKYTRDEELKYTFHGNDDHVCIEEQYCYLDDDGQSGKNERVYNTGREILRMLNKIFEH